MLLAVKAPVLKSMAVAGAALLVGALAVGDRDDATKTLRLELHAPKQCGAIYDTAWAKGDVRVAVPAGDPKRLVFKQRGFHWNCAIEATEVLTPISADRYHYSYDEDILWCRGDAANYVITTPRQGFVRVVPE
jgi:hypothetical protein